MPSFGSDLINSLEERQVRVVDKPWGIMYEIHVPEKDLIIKMIQVEAGYRTSKQYHVEKDEVAFVLQGDGMIEGPESPDEALLRPSRGMRNEPGAVHRTTGPVLLLEFTTDHDDDVVRLEDDHGRA